MVSINCPVILVVLTMNSLIITSMAHHSGFMLRHNKHVCECSISQRENANRNNAGRSKNVTSMEEHMHRQLRNEYNLCNEVGELLVRTGRTYEDVIRGRPPSPGSCEASGELAVVEDVSSDIASVISARRHGRKNDRTHVRSVSSGRAARSYRHVAKFCPNLLFS